jgi:hypothetical protein
MKKYICEKEVESTGSITIDIEKPIDHVIEESIKSTGIKSNFYIEKIIIKNIVPFTEDINLDFKENKNIILLTALNGKGKSTILSYIADAFFEIQNFYQDTKTKYRCHSYIYAMDSAKSSFTYIRFRMGDKCIDYVYIDGKCSQRDYEETIRLNGKIDFIQRIEPKLMQEGYVKVFSPNFNKNIAGVILKSNVLKNFPAYRYEIPQFIDETYMEKCGLNKEVISDGIGLEVVSNIRVLGDWAADIISGVVSNSRDKNEKSFFYIFLVRILQMCFISKDSVASLAIKDNAVPIILPLSPTKFNVGTHFPGFSSGEGAICSIFAEILRESHCLKQIQLPLIPGIVLIDEVDKHLHAKLQKEILPKLFSLFPNVQFIFSSHSPFVSLGLRENEKTKGRLEEIDLNKGGIDVDDTTSTGVFNEAYEIMIDLIQEGTY